MTNWRQHLRGDLRLLAGLFLAALATGLLANGLRPTPLPLAVSPTEPLPTVLHAEVQLVAQGSQPGLLIDARSATFYRLGHIPGALNLPRKTFNDDYARLQAQLKSAPRLIVYCSGESCEDSDWVAQALRQRGHPNVHLYPGGWEEWRNTP